MNDFERKRQIIDLTVIIALFVAGCIIGKLVMNIYDTWLSFNVPAIGILAVGELLWFRLIRKKLTMCIWVMFCRQGLVRMLQGRRL